MCRISVFLLIILILFVSAYSLPPTDYQGEEQNNENKIVDVQSYFDANNLLMFVTNKGGLAEDWSAMWGKADGFYFPYSGSCQDIIYGDDKTVLYSAGLCLGGKVGGEIRTAVGAYDSPEYFPGPTDEYGNYQADIPRYKVYKIWNDSSIWMNPSKPDCARDDSIAHFNDWQLWKDSAALDGAPLDGSSDPLLLGDQTLWSVYNDGGPHDYNGYGGGTNPLNVEIHQTIWGSDEPGEENVVYVKYKLYNRGSNYIDSFYISFWADPDLGYASDDYVGCDSANEMFFCYNAYSHDNVYGDVPPAWGGQVVYGPVVSSPGDTAVFDGNLMPGFKNLGMSSFAKYINGTDPDNPEELYAYMQGFDAKGTSGPCSNPPYCPYIDPNTGDTTKFPVGGDPITGSGWLDGLPADRRLMANMGPISFDPGDSQCVVIKLAAAQDTDRLTSLCTLKNILDSACSTGPAYVTPDSIRTEIIDDAGLRDVYFYGSPRWISFVNWGGDYFYGSSDYGYDFWGGYLNPLTMPDSFSTVEIRFNDNDPASGQRAYNYLRPGYSYQGYFQVPFEVWDTDHNRQLNACFVEYNGSDVYDSTWGPDATGTGGREYLLLLNSDYDGDNPGDAGTGALDYTAMDFAMGSDFDFLYAGWFRIRDGFSLSDMNTGQKLIFDHSRRVNDDPYADSIIFEDTPVGGSTYQELKTTCYTSGVSKLRFEISQPTLFHSNLTALDFYDQNSNTIVIYFTPQFEGYQFAYLSIVDDLTSIPLATMKLVGIGSQATDVDDENDDLLPADYVLKQNYPNPFNPTTIISFSLPRSSNVQLEVFNILGRRVTTLIDDELNPGNYNIIWNGRNSSGQSVSSGVYFYRLKAGEFVVTKKMILLK